MPSIISGSDNFNSAAATGGFGQVFTSSGTFTIPTGVTALKAYACGGGGGSSNNNTNGGGGAGATAIKFLTGLTPGATLTVTIGAGGGAGGTGGDTTISSGTQVISTLTGGGGGPATNFNGGIGGTATGGDINMRGGGGQGYGQQVGAYAGGDSFFCGGNRGTNGTLGAGGGSYNTSGGSGVVMFEW